MLTPTTFSELNDAFCEVNVRETHPEMYAIESTDRLKMCMARSGAGASFTSRELAAAAGVAHGTIGALMSGAQTLVPKHKAAAIADALHVSFEFLWIPMERAGRVFIPSQAGA